jgi:hypothetical protein
VLRNETAARSVGQFSAHIAKSLCKLLQARRVLDPCAGWGDRLAPYGHNGAVALAAVPTAAHYWAEFSTCSSGRGRGASP